MGRPRRSDEEIWKDVLGQLKMYKKIDRKTGCWIWVGRKWPGKPYGRLYRVPRKVPGISSRVHVFSYLLTKGEIPLGKMICHSCFTASCFNPEHLFAGTNSENQLCADAQRKFKRYWTKKRRALFGASKSGKRNPMYGMRGKLAPCFGRRGEKHPMFGKRHKEESKLKISKSLRKTYEKRNKRS